MLHVQCSLKCAKSQEMGWFSLEQRKTHYFARLLCPSVANDGQGIDTLREEWERLFGVPDSSLRSELPGIQECREVVSSRDCLWTAEWL